jgi:hypothetical protein
MLMQLLAAPIEWRCFILFYLFFSAFFINAIPHLGQTPSLFKATSGCIGQGQTGQPRKLLLKKFNSY